MACSAIPRPPRPTTTTTTTTTKRPYVPPPTTPKPEAPCLYKEISLAGDGYVQLKDKLMASYKSKAGEKLRIEITFATRQSDGLILWQGQATGDNHFVAIGRE